MSDSPGLPPDWRMPEGVDSPLWWYTTSERLAQDEESYFAGHPLLAADLHWVCARLAACRDIIDLGCGTGRAARSLARRGCRVMAVDLSQPMLAKLSEETTREDLDVLAVLGNICSLAFIRDAAFDAALMLFSTLGMIRGRDLRRKALAEARRVVRPGGWLLLHAHNLAENLRDPQARTWWARQMLALALGNKDVGDRPMTYRGIARLVVHQYRWAELRADLASAGWQVRERVAIDARTAQSIRADWFLPTWRAGGWLVAARARSAT